MTACCGRGGPENPRDEGDDATNGELCRTMWRRNVRSGLYAFITVAAFIGLLEVAGRVALSLSGRPKGAAIPALLGNDSSWCRPSTALGWEGIPHYSGSPYGTKVRLNSMGFRSEEWGPRSARAFRILYIGDSLTFGYGIDYEKTFPCRTARILSEKAGGIPIETCNAGVPGYSSFQGLKVLERLCDAVRPDAVVWEFGYNDRRLANLEPDSDRTLFLVGAMGHIHEWMGPVIRRSGLLTYIFGRSRVTTARKKSGPPRVSVEGFASNRDTFVRYVSSRNMIPVVVVVRDNPRLEDRITTADRYLAQGELDAALELYRAGDDLAAQLLTRRYGALKMKEAGYPVMADELLDGPLFDWNLTHGGLPSVMDRPYREAGAAPLEGFSFPVVRADLMTNEESLFIDLCHLNEEGNRRVGEALAQALLPFVLQWASKGGEVRGRGN